MKNNNNLIIYSGTRAWYELLLAAVFYTIAIYKLLILLYDLTIGFDTYEAIISLNEFFVYGLPSLASAIAFSGTKDIEIGNKATIISYYKVGPFTKVVKTPAIDFEYVSVFQEYQGIFQTNLWYKGNKHYKMYEFEIKEEAFRFGALVSDKLNIDLLDATEKGNNQWVDKEKI